MATVRYTAEVGQLVEGLVRKGFIPREESLLERINESLTLKDIIEAFVEQSGGQELFGQCSQWMENTASKYIYNLNGVSLSSYLNSDIQLSCPVIPYMLVIPALQPNLDERTRLNEELVTLTREQSRVVSQVNKAFSSYSSINAAIKAHPDLELMLPDSVKEMLLIKPSPKIQKPAAKYEFDISDLKTLATITRLSGA